MANEEAPAGAVWVCTACGKRSQDRYGNKSIDFGWDVSCMLNAVLAREDHLVPQNGRVVAVEEGGVLPQDKLSSRRGHGVAIPFGGDDPGWGDD